jgi:hypothetical protein
MKFTAAVSTLLLTSVCGFAPTSVPVRQVGSLTCCISFEKVVQVCYFLVIYFSLLIISCNSPLEHH